MNQRHFAQDAFDNVLAETTIGLYKTECARRDSPFRCGPITTLPDLEGITSAWVHRVLHEPSHASA